MLGLILNVHAPEQSREEQREQPAVFVLEDGFPVFEVWFWHANRWWCMSKSYNLNLARQGVVYFDSAEELKRALALFGRVA